MTTRLGVSQPEAERFVRQKLSSLTKKNFVGTDSLSFDDGTILADVYGINDEHGGWYIKFYVEHGRVQVVSCHEPEWPLTCADGTRVT